MRRRLEEVLSRPNVLAELKSDPGPLGLDTLLAEISKLSTVRALGLTEAVFADASDKIVAAWRARAARMYPSDFADCPPAVRHTLLPALCWSRQAELVDGLVELLIGLIHRINARAEQRVEKELIGAVYPVVPGGVKTLSALARELKATERAVAEKVRYQHGCELIGGPASEGGDQSRGPGEMMLEVARVWRHLPVIVFHHLPVGCRGQPSPIGFCCAGTGSRVVAIESAGNRRDHEPACHVRVTGSQLEADHAAEAEAEEIRLIDGEFAEQCLDIAGEVLPRHLAPGVCGVPVPWIS